MERIVMVVCLLDGLSGFHPRKLFFEGSLEGVRMVHALIVRGEYQDLGLGMVHHF